MKIALLTYTTTQDNYGQVLQGYALSTYLRGMGHTVNFVSYDTFSPVPQCISLAKAKAPSRLAKYLGFLLHPMTYLESRKRFRISQWRQRNPRDFDAFRRAHFSFEPTTTYYTALELRDNPPQADAYVCGSDQIWAVLPQERNSGWFLDYGNDATPRIAYAVSVGSAELSEEKCAYMRRFLPRFTAISVREESALPLCRELAGKEVSHCVDPTLLLKREDYLRLVPQEVVEQARVFAYFVNVQARRDVFWQQLYAWCQSSGLVLDAVASAGCVDAVQQLPLDKIHGATVPQWLYELACARYVYTDSFHGTVLAIIFRKPFLVTLVQGLHAPMNTRVFSLLESLGLSERIYRGDTPLPQAMQAPIAWDEVEERLETLVGDSQQFLQQCFQKRHAGH